MKSKWFNLKPTAIALRRRGTSLREVEKTLNIPRSTLSGWFRKIKLTDAQKKKLRINWLVNLSKARLEAVKWHNQQKKFRISVAEAQADEMLLGWENNNPLIMELAMAMLYLGEGLKTTGLGMGNSDPLILRFFVHMLIKIYNIDVRKIKCSLHLRADQNPEILKRYWSRNLNLPLTNFTSPSIDKRTVGHSTYSSYNGVCVIHCGNIAIQRRLLFLSRKYCQSIIKGG